MPCQMANSAFRELNCLFTDHWFHQFHLDNYFTKSTPDFWRSGECRNLSSKFWKGYQLSLSIMKSGKIWRICLLKMKLAEDAQKLLKSVTRWLRKQRICIQGVVISAFSSKVGTDVHFSWVLRPFWKNKMDFELRVFTTKKPWSISILRKLRLPAIRGDVFGYEVACHHGGGWTVWEENAVYFRFGQNWLRSVVESFYPEGALGLTDVEAGSFGFGRR